MRTVKHFIVQFSKENPRTNKRELKIPAKKNRRWAVVPSPSPNLPKGKAKPKTKETKELNYWQSPAQKGMPQTKPTKPKHLRSLEVSTKPVQNNRAKGWGKKTLFTGVLLLCVIPLLLHCLPFYHLPHSRASITLRCAQVKREEGAMTRHTERGRHSRIPTRAHVILLICCCFFIMILLQ